ncbi:MAG TPA: hypothetical protein PLQ57_04495 [Saprospiraceae bacterium]|nr:hypothetical protein [Saprospiraceae bacterium]
MSTITISEPIKLRKPAAPLDHYHHLEQIQVGEWFYSVWFVFSYTTELWEDDLPDGRSRVSQVYDFPKEEIKIRALMGCHESEEELKPMKQIDPDKYEALIDAICNELENNAEFYV